MQQEKSNWTIKKKLILSLVIFTISYIFFLFLWVKIQDHYGKVLLSMASHLTAKVIDVELITIKGKKDEVFSADFYISRQGKVSSGIIPFDFNQFIYNVPLTLAIMAALCLSIKQHIRAYIEALTIIFTIHFLYVFLYEVFRLSQLLSTNNLESVSGPELLVWYSLWGFSYTILIRFEPFLIGIYLYLRFSKTTLKPKKRYKSLP